mgnify:FL=1
MADIRVPGELSGKEYNIRIAGDSPTADERQRIDAFVRQSETQFAGEYEAQFGENLLPSTGFGAQISETFRGIPRGVGSLLQSSATGLATPFGEETELKAREGIRSLGASLQDRFAVPVGREGMVGGTLGEGLGSTLPFFALAPFGPVGIAAGAGLGASAGAGEASERARRAGATEEERNAAIPLGGLVGLSEVAVPVALRGLFRGLLRSGVPETTIRARLNRIATASTAEGAQEAAAEFLQNSIEAGIYNPEKDLQDGLLPAAGVGGGVGGIIQALVELGTRSRGPSVSSSSTTPAATDPAEPMLALPAPPLGLPAPELSIAPTSEQGQRLALSPPSEPSAPLITPPPPAVGDVALITPAPAPTVDEMVALMDELGIPRTAALRNSVRAGTIRTNEQLRERLAKFAKATTSDRAAPVNDYLARETLDGTSNDTIEPEQSRDRAGVADSGAQLGDQSGTVPVAGSVETVGPVTPDTPAVGGAVEGAPLPVVAEREQPATLAAVEPAGVQVGGIDEAIGNGVGEIAVTEEGKPVPFKNFALSVDGDRAEVGMVERERGKTRAGVGRDAYVALGEALAGKGVTLQSSSTLQAPGKKLWERLAQEGKARRNPQTKRFEFTTGEPTVSVEPAATPAPEGETFANKVRAAAARGTRTSADVLVEDNEIAARAAALAETSPAQQTVVEGSMAGATPGLESGAAGQNIPAPIAPAATPPSVDGSVQNVVSGLNAQREKLIEDDTKGFVQGEIDTWYDENTSAEKKDALNRFTLTDEVASPIPAADMRSVLSLLQSAPKTRAKGKITPRQAAFTYFSMSPDIDYVLRSIAYDQAQNMETDANNREPSFRRETQFEDSSEAALYDGTGREPALRAARWIRDNLSEQARNTVATYTFNDYRPIDYAAASDARDITQAREKALKAEVEEIITSTYGDSTPDADTAADLGFATEDLGGLGLAHYSAGTTSWLGNSHPRVEERIRAGDVRGALEGLAITAHNRTHRKLAAKLLAKIGDVRSEVVPDAMLREIMVTLDPEGVSPNDETAGAYIIPASEKTLAALRREGREDAVTVLETYGGQLLFNANASLSPELILHEATHAVTDAVLDNKSHPLTRQLEKLRIELLKFLPPGSYGLVNVHELLSEGMANTRFRRDLSSANVNGEPFSAWAKFKNIMANWLRGLIGRSPVKPDSAKDAVDRALDEIIAINPNEINSGDIMGASFTRRRGSNILGDAIRAARVPTKADLAVTRKVLGSKVIPVKWKGVLMNLAMPLDYVADAAKKYIPAARLVPELVGQHQAEIQNLTTEVIKSTDATAKVFGKYVKDQPLITKLNDLAYFATRQQVDPRKPASAYKGYSFQYNVLDKDGNITRRQQSKRYGTETERNKALQSYNAALSTAGKRTRLAIARRAFDEDRKVTADYDFVREGYDSLPPDLKTEFSRMLELQPYVGKGYVEAIRSRIETALPRDKALQDKIFGVIYDKILSEQLLDPYLNMARSGEFWLSYGGIDPLSVTFDPVTGQADMVNVQVEQFKHSFETEAERADAIRVLQALPAEQRVTNINPYQQASSGFTSQDVPLDFVGKVLDAIDTSGALVEPDDSVTGQPLSESQKIASDLRKQMVSDTRQQIINLMLDASPESSFINSFKRRQGIRGFKGDATPITAPKASGDVLKNLRSSAMTIARKTADLKYGAEFARARALIRQENETFQGTNPNSLSPEILSRQRAEAAQYTDTLVNFTEAPFKVRSKVSRGFGAGTYMLTLGFNASTALVTLSQIPLFVYPVLAGSYSDMRAVGALGAANRILAAAGRERTVNRVGPDGKVETVTEKVPFFEYSTEYNDAAYLAPLIEFAKANGVFNRSLMQDELLGEQANLWEKVAASTGIMQHQAERYSRETALNAAYILEMQDLTGRQDMSVKDFVKGLEDGDITFTQEQARAAAETAVNVSEKSNGPIYAAAGPIASMGNFTSLVYMFKRHPISMMNLIAQTTKRSAGADPEDRRIAQRQIVRMFGGMAVMAGAMGMPLAQQFGWAYDLLFQDDDEPDFETMLRMTLGEAGTFGLVDYLSGLKVSERIGLGAPIYRPGFASQNSPPLFQIAEGVGGPVLGMGLKYLSERPFQDLAEGDVGRFFEGVAPSSIANALRAMRYSSEGAATRRGDIVDDVGRFNIAAQAFGFMPTSYAQKLDMNSFGTNVNNAINRGKSRLLQRLNRARSEGDFEQMRDIEVDIQEFNARNPRNQILPETRRQSYRASLRVTAETTHGLYTSPANRSRIQGMLDAWSPATISQ